MDKWVITCEHGGNQIPAAYASYFQEAAAVLHSHRGYDPGALELYHLLAKELADFSQFSQTSRLLVELNRSLHHKDLFSAYTKSLKPLPRKEILASYYLPYRELVEEKIGQFINEGNAVTHLSIHSFTPELNGEVRKADIGLLYDPSRKEEKDFCEQWKKEIAKIAPELLVRFNYPYKGTADGFTTYLRKRFSAGYKGIELEINQKYAHSESLQEVILMSLQQVKSNK